MSGPDPKVKRHEKTERRVKDRDAVVSKLLAQPWCRVGQQAAVLGESYPGCTGRGANGHHLVPKGSPHLGDDAEDNIIPLCGSGTTGCHGDVTLRRGDARLLIGESLLDPANRAELDYVLDKLGKQEGMAWLYNEYRVMVPG